MKKNEVTWNLYTPPSEPQDPPEIHGKLCRCQGRANPPMQLRR